MGLRLYGLKENISEYIIKNSFIEDPEFYTLQRYKLGVAEASQDMVFEKSYPLEFRMDKLHAIDFKKGCYVGQEVTTRTHHRGVIRKALYKIQSDHDLTYTHNEVLQNNKVIGFITSSYKNLGLALLRIEEIDEKESVFCEDIELTLTPIIYNT